MDMPRAGHRTEINIPEATRKELQAWKRWAIGKVGHKVSTGEVVLGIIQDWLAKNPVPPEDGRNVLDLFNH
jgi:hypothetical protein